MEAAVALATTTIHSSRLKESRESGILYECPSDVDPGQLEDLHLIIKYPEEKKT